MRVFIIEEEAALRFFLVKGVQRLEGVEAIGFERLKDALAAIEDSRPDVIISDLNRPERSGLELLSEINARSMRIPVIFISESMDTDAQHISSGDGIEVLEKPVALEDLRELVLKHKAPENLHEAGEVHFSVAEFVQLSCLGNHSVALDLYRQGIADAVGQIIIYLGDVWVAQDKQGEGERAFVRMALLSDVSVKCTALQAAPSSKRVSLEWQHLLLLAAKALDEQRLTECREDPEEALPEVTSAPSSEPQSDSIGTHFDDPTLPVEQEPVAIGERDSEPQAPLASSPESSSSEAMEEAVPSLRDLLREAPSQPDSTIELEEVPSLRELLASVGGPDPTPSMKELDAGFEQRTASTQPITNSSSDVYSDREFARMLEQGTSALIAKDYATAREFLEGAALLRPSDRTVEVNLDRLKKLGFN